MPRNKTAKRTHRRKGGFISYFNPFTKTYKPFQNKEYRKKAFSVQEEFADIRKVEPNKLELSVDGTTETMQKPGETSVLNAYTPEVSMKSHYDELKGLLSTNKDCLDEEIYGKFKDMDEVCMKKNWIMRKTNKNCRLVDQLKNKNINRMCEPDSHVFLSDEELDEMRIRQEEEAKKEDERWDIKGGKSRRRHKKSRHTSTRRRSRSRRHRRN